MCTWDMVAPVVAKFAYCHKQKPKMTYFHKQRVMTIQCMVRYGPLSNLKKTSRYLTNECDQVSCKIWIKTNRLREPMALVRRMDIQTEGQTRVTLN